MASQEDSPVDLVCQTVGSAYFDEVIGHIEDIVLSEKFQTLHDNFLERNWRTIENTEENKLEYMDIFQEYTATFEGFFVAELGQRMHNFDMARFADELEENNAFNDVHNISEIFELLYSFTNFQTFKELMLDYRDKKEGNVQHLEFDILITKPMVCLDVEATTTSQLNDNTNAVEAAFIAIDTRGTSNEAQ